MAEAASFDQENTIFNPPEGVSNKDCNSISAYRGDINYEDEDGNPMSAECVITCWRLTKEELEEVNRTGRIWLYIHGTGMPPVSVSGSNPFERK
jgi:hypothetical protein